MALFQGINHINSLIISSTKIQQYYEHNSYMEFCAPNVSVIPVNYIFLLSMNYFFALQQREWQKALLVTSMRWLFVPTECCMWHFSTSSCQRHLVICHPPCWRPLELMCEFDFPYLIKITYLKGKRKAKQNSLHLPTPTPTRTPKGLTSDISFFFDFQTILHEYIYM